MQQGNLLNQIRGWVGALTASALLAGCQAPAAPGPQPAPAAVSFALDAASLTTALAHKPNRIWQDGLLSYQPLVQQLKARANASRGLLGVGTEPWSYNVGAACSSVPTYAKVDVNYPGSTPAAGDLLYVLTDAGKILKINPTTGAVLATSPTLPSTYSKSALVLSGDNYRLYALSVGGDFTVVNANTLAVQYTASISTKGFAGSAPFLDYGLNTSGGTTPFGSIENIFAVSGDGSVYKMHVDITSGSLAVTVNAAPSSTGTDKSSVKPAWATNVPLTLPAAVTLGGFMLAWKGQVYFGGAGNTPTTGHYYDVNMTNPSAPVLAHDWDLTKFTSATGAGRGISAPATFDFDNNFDVNALFVPCGDRIDWIDPVANTITASAALSLDHSAALTSPAAPANPTAGALTSYTPAGNTLKTYNPDWISIKSGQLPSPSRWGGPLGTLSTGISCVSVRIDSANNTWVCNYSTSSVTIYHANGTPATNIALAGKPTKLEFDGLGNCWISEAGFATNGSSGFVEKISPAGTRFTTGNFPVTFNGAVYIAPDANGNCWVTDPYNRPGTTGPNSIGSSGSAGRMQCLLPDGSFGYKNPIALATAATVFCDPNNFVWAMPYGGNAIYKMGPAPVAANTNTPALPTAYTAGAAGSTPIGIAFRPTQSPPEAWVTLNNASKIAVLNMTTGATLRTLPSSGTGPTNPWSIRFDSLGNPWTSNCLLTATTTQNVTELNPTTGAITQTYSMSAFGNPFELVFDSSNTAYVACTTPSFSSGALVNISNLGDTLDLFATSYRGTPGDGDDSYSLMQFDVPANAWANLSPSKVALTLTQANILGTPDNLDFFTASNLPLAGTAAWIGYTGASPAPNVDWNNRPTVTASPFFSATGINPGQNGTYTVNLPVPADQANVTGDTANAHFTVASRSTNKALASAIHWYSKLSAGSTTAYYPTLSVALGNYAQTSTTVGIQCQASVDSNTRKLYVCASNALFTLDYSSPQAYQLPSNTFYNFTQAGGSAGYGPVNTSVSPKTYLNAVGNTILTFSGRAIVADVNPSTSQLYLNNFDLTQPATSNRLVTTLDLTPGKTAVAAQMLYDYELGSAYFVTTNNYVIRASVLQ